ncbi:MAG: IS630 family transposase [Spirochaetia bacterium]|jgi:putative transposase
MAARNIAPVVMLEPIERTQLESFSRSRTLSHSLVMRAQIVLRAADGEGNMQIATVLKTTRETVGKWRKRFDRKRLEGLYDELRSGRPRSVEDERIAQLINKTLARKPQEATQWTCRSMAKSIGVSKSMVHRVWKTFGLQPHRQRSFKLSTDPFFVEKVRDIVGLYLNPPQNAMVLCVDEKSQCQALERTQPMLPMGLGYVEGVTHDYVRHGTTTLFAALDIANGQVLTDCKPRHRHQEFLDFLRTIEANVPKKLDIHIVLDNYGSHKHPKVKAWLAGKPRYHIHFTPTYSSWLNQVERWFGLITQRAIRRGSFSSVKELVQKIEEFVKHHNRTAKPFIWTATADSIFAKLQRLCERISGT